MKMTYLSLTDKIEQKVIQFLHFNKVVSNFVFLLYHECVESCDVISQNKMFPLQKNSLLSKWSQVNDIIQTVTVLRRLLPVRARCYNFLKRLYACIDAPIATISDACLTMSNITLKAFVLNNSDCERELGCLRTKEK